MANEQMAQRSTQLQQLNQQLVNQQRMFQQSLEIQGQQSQAQLGSLTNLGAAQVSKTTYGARDFQAKAFSKMKGFKGDEKTRPDWRCKFRVEASRCLHHAAAILDWAENRYDQPISEADTRPVAATENPSVLVNFNMQLHGDLVSLMEQCAEGFENMRTTKTEVGLDAWRLLSHKYDARNPLRNIQLLEELRVACTDASWLLRSDCTHGEARARDESSSPELWR